MNTSLADVTNQIQQVWSPLFTKELREKLLLGSLVNKDYQGEIKFKGDTVKVSQINAPNGQLLTVGTDADSFTPEKLTTTQIEIKADRRAVASFEMEDLIQLQSQIGDQDSEIRSSLLFAVEKQINDHLYSLVSPSISAPDHERNSIVDFNASEISTLRLLASQAKWMRNKPWWILCDPSYYSDILNASTLTSSDFVGNETPIVGGQVAKQRFGFNILEDDSRPTDTAIAFHPDFMHLVMQTEVNFKVSDLHAQGKFGFVISADIVFGAKLGINGNVKHIRSQAAA